MNNSYPKLQFNEILQQTITSTGLSVSQFSTQSGIDLPDRFYRALKPNGVKLGLDTLHSIVSRFPELNMDRFVRFSGPVLLSELCEDFASSKPVNTIVSKPTEHYQILMDGKDKEISRLEEEVKFLRGLLTK